MGIIDQFITAAKNGEEVEEIPTMAMESYFLNKDDLGWRLDDWQKDKCPFLFITGHAGSGKSTLANTIAAACRATKIELDWLDRMYTQSEDSKDYFGWKMFTDAEDIILKQLGKTAEDVRTMNFEEQKSLIQATWKEFEKKARTTKRRYVIEGVQVFRYFSDLDMIYQVPIIIKGTSAAVSLFRAYRRGHWRIMMNGQRQKLHSCIQMWLGSEKRCKDFMTRMLSTGEPETFDLDKPAD